MTAASKPKRLIGYCRVSTAGQASSGISLDEQRHRIEQYAQAHGYELAAVEIERGASGKTTRRPAFQPALATLAKREADGLIAVKLDRISRSIRDTIRLISRADREGWEVHSLSERLDTSSAMGRFVVHLFAALAQLEREQISERTKGALAELRRQGKRVSGKPPLGYRFEGVDPVEVEGEQETLSKIQTLRADGLGARRIAADLNDAGIGNPRTGRKWRPATLQHTLRRLDA